MQKNAKYVHNQDELKEMSKGDLVTLKCVKCGKFITFKKHSGRGKLRSGRETTFKCRQCNLSDQNKAHPEWQQLALKNNRKNHGGIMNFQTKEGLSASKRYRDNTPDWHDKTVASNYNNHGGKHHSQLKCNRDRMRKQGSEMGKKSIALFEYRHGVRSPMLVEEYKESQQKSNRNNHGGLLYQQTKDCKDRMKMSMIKNIGEIVQFGSKYTNDSIIKAMREYIDSNIVDLYLKNLENNMNFQNVISLYRKLCPEKFYHKYIFDGESFDSIPELAVYVFNKDFGIPIIRNHSLSLQFKDKKDKIRETTPDFIINGRLIEIKGAHFFKPDGTMYCPFRKPGWSDERYAYECDIYNRKYLCGLANGVIYILDPSPYITTCMTYIYNKYTKSFIRSLNTSDPKFIGKGYTPYTMDKSTEYQQPIGRSLTSFDIK